jgi:hypothetical protein
MESYGRTVMHRREEPEQGYSPSKRAVAARDDVVRIDPNASPMHLQVKCASGRWAITDRGTGARNWLDCRRIEGVVLGRDDMATLGTITLCRRALAP